MPALRISLICWTWRMMSRTVDWTPASFLSSGVETLGGLLERLEGPVGLLARTDDGVVLLILRVGQRTGGAVALLLERGGELGGLLRHVREVASCSRAGRYCRGSPGFAGRQGMVAATTGSASSETRRVLMRQLRRAARDPGPGGVRYALGRDSVAARTPGATARVRHRCAAAGPLCWARCGRSRGRSCRAAPVPPQRCHPS